MRADVPRVPGAPRLTQARCESLREISVLDEYGERRRIHIPDEQPLTVFVDKRELVTLMTLGALPELLVLGFLLNQRLVADVREVESITVDWQVQAAAVNTWRGVKRLAQRTRRRVVTTGCGQGTVYGDAQAQLDHVRLPNAQTARFSQAALRRLLEVVRAQDSIHRRAGSVHGCALFEAREGGELLMFVEDVGRHNAVDSITGWMAMHGVAGADKVLYTTGRLTSEMVGKAAAMGLPVIVSRNGVTAMGQAMAERLGMALFGRAANRHFLCYCGFDRFDADPLPPPAYPVRVVSG